MVKDKLQCYCLKYPVFHSLWNCLVRNVKLTKIHCRYWPALFPLQAQAKQNTIVKASETFCIFIVHSLSAQRYHTRLYGSCCPHMTHVRARQIPESFHRLAQTQIHQIVLSHYRQSKAQKVSLITQKKGTETEKELKQTF